VKALIIKLIIVIIVVVWYLFRPEKSFISKRVNEVFPDVKEKDRYRRESVLTLVVAGGGFDGDRKRAFILKTIGEVASIGRRTGVANILGFKFSGFLAWLLWRIIYLTKLPRFEKKLRVFLDWTLDLFFSKDIV